MPAVDTPNLGLKHQWNFRESGWNAQMDANLVKLGALVQASALDKDLAAPPVGPSAGDRYLIAAGASGAWAGHEQTLTVWDGAAWQFYAPAEGWMCWIADEDKLYVWSGAGWTAHDPASGTYLPISGGTLTGTLNGRDIAPTANNTYALGTSGSRFANVYGVLGNFSGALTALSVSLTGAGQVGGSGGIAILDGSTEPRLRAGYSNYVGLTAAAFYASTAVTLGTSGARWGKFWGGDFDLLGTALIAGGFSIFPAASGRTAGVMRTGGTANRDLTFGVVSSTGGDGSVFDFVNRIGTSHFKIDTVNQVITPGLPFASLTITGALTANGNSQLGDADGDDVFLRGLGRGLIMSTKMVATAMGASGDHTWVAPGAGSLILVHGKGTYGSPGNFICIRKNGADWVWIPTPQDNGPHKFSSKAAKGACPFAAGDEITLRNDAGTSNVSVDLEFIVDTYVNTTLGDLTADVN